MDITGKSDAGRRIFPLTGLQIGDLQSYLSDLSLVLASESRKFYILVDNRPWLRGSRPAHFWQLMVTKSRLSPFANSKVLKARKLQGKDVSSKPVKPKKFTRWVSYIKAEALSRKRVLLPVKKLRNSLLSSSELHRTLYGFIVFEVAWSNVRGINYLNELQTDTSLATEAKFMQRWEFDSIPQAANCISSWYSGTASEKRQLREYLDSLGEVFYDAQATLPVDVEDEYTFNRLSSEESSLHSISSNYSVCSPTSKGSSSVPHSPPPPTGPYKRRKIADSICIGDGVDVNFEEFPDCETYVSDYEDAAEVTQDMNDIPVNVKTHMDCEEATSYREDAIPVPVKICDSGCQDAVEATQYSDVLILFRFNDHDLPFKLRDIIMSDLRLLPLLEAGLPSWAIFLQSYPGFCKIYRPWMCPLARALYVVISVATVLIGFYDLYKNVPVLKVTASRICGPLFDWIETWSMVTRIKYLGTMLFLHHSQKAVQWFLTIRKTTRSFFSVFAQPILEPFVQCFGFLLPVWNVFFEVLGSICTMILLLIESSCNVVENLVEVLLYPVWFVLSAIWNIAISVVYPIFRMLWAILYAPIRMFLVLGNFIAFLITCIYDTLQDTWKFISSIFQFASASQATVRTVEVSIWRSLWNDLFSQVFRALRSILNGFVAFFTACNRHRLSIYNHIQEFNRRLLNRTKRLRREDSRRSRQTIEGHQLLRMRRKIALD
ncbi:uncharacterized protein LOC126797584 [Argentina anserina]|uniref:uncharacterized protein LOC126797584 n=1 Tax=Argentina anserina TaxID=57926 RepID=UPI00217688B6|nr:uncharacterized protein LOC126797584 [Potentilla anserina]XP_050380193.1 uncharacterized protein LOC126797584 [Potentilla anserina]